MHGNYEPLTLLHPLHLLSPYPISHNSWLLIFWVNLTMGYYPIALFIFLIFVQLFSLDLVIIDCEFW